MNNRSIDTIYEYKDTAGNPLFQVVRFKPKGFAQRRQYKGFSVWGLSEGWYQKNSNSNDYHKINNVSKKNTYPPPNRDTVWFDGIEIALYHLPELLLGIQTGKEIFICEGEKDADNLAALGFITTTCPMGAGKWRKSYTETLRECREAIIIADKDEVGRLHAKNVAYKLYSAGITIKLLELPDIETTKTKDFSDWLDAGGNKEKFEELVGECPEWEPSENPETNNESGFQKLTALYGDPYYTNSKGQVTSINQNFWAGLFDYDNIVIFEPDEKQFYQYEHDNGLYKTISENSIKREISNRILSVSRQKNLLSLEKKVTNSSLDNIVKLLKGISEKRNAFNKDKKIVHLVNGVIEFKDNGESDFCSFSPEYFSRNQCPIPFDPSAACTRFLNDFLYQALNSDAVELVQKYTGLCLIGNNIVQKMLIFDGKPGCGKTTLALIIQSLVGQVNVTELRTNHLNSRFELFRYLKKKLLVGVDVPGEFLSKKGAHKIKGLIGGDWFDAEQKGGTASFPIQGNFCVLITSNSRLRVKLDGDTGAWRRRLLIVRFEGPAPEKIIPGLKDILIREEGSGILNWALQGLKMVLKDIEAYGDIQLSETQKKTVEGLLAENDSLRYFLMEKVVHDPDADLSTTEIIEAYAEYCPLKGWNPKPITIIQRELQSLVLELFATSKSNSIKRDGKSTRGFRRVTFKTEEEE